MMSSSTEVKKSLLSSVECPACHQLVVLEMINQHLDRCVEAEHLPADLANRPNEISQRLPAMKKARAGLLSTASAPPAKNVTNSAASKEVIRKVTHPFFQTRAEKKNDSQSSSLPSAKKFRGDVIELDNDSSSSSPTQIDTVDNDEAGSHKKDQIGPVSSNEEIFSSSP
ncbi:hypothetical protein BIW11_06628, partial [Tropilaelaps mercedesae]